MLTLVTGTGPFALGRAIVDGIQRKASTAVIGIDLQQSAIPNNAMMSQIQFDLNPLAYPAGHCAWLGHLKKQIQTVAAAIAPNEPIARLVLSAGRYYAGTLLEHDSNVRSQMAGLHVVGKLELVYLVMEYNRSIGADNRRALTLMDIGSLHSVLMKPHRSVYAASKAFGATLCLCLHRGEEIARAIYIAPGAIDTPMLHRNHWEIKEHGPPDFWRHVFTNEQALYSEVFVNCSSIAVTRALHTYGGNADKVRGVHERYAARRASLEIIDSATLGDRLAEMLIDESTFLSGEYRFTAPNGVLAVAVEPW